MDIVLLRVRCINLEEVSGNQELFVSAWEFLPNGKIYYVFVCIFILEFTTGVLCGCS